MAAKVLYDDGHLRLEQSVFGALKATSVDEGRTIKASRAEKGHLMNTLEILSDRGVDISPDNHAVMSMFADYCEALLAPGPRAGMWQVIFTRLPEEIADAIEAQVNEAE